jgi:hypothetical protein
MLVASPIRFTRVLLTLTLATTATAASAQQPAPAPDLARQVEVRRTAYGVPHIKAENLQAAAYALAYVQLEDYGPSIAMGLLRGRGEMGRWFGRDSMEGDFLAQRAYAIAVSRYATLDPSTRDVYEGFAAGVNRYIALHPEEFPAGFAPHFTGYDVAARDVNLASLGVARPRPPSAPTRRAMRVPIQPSTASKKAPTPGRSRRAARNRGARSSCATRTSPGLRATTRRTSPCPACSTSTATSASAARSA